MRKPVEFTSIGQSQRLVCRLLNGSYIEPDALAESRIFAFNKQF
jgi:hypothetical protein